MKVKFKNNPSEICYSSEFNIHSLSEVIVGGDWGMDSCFIKDLDVYIEKLKEWKDMGAAFRDSDLINDNYNTIFFEPRNEEDRKNGFTKY